MDNKKKQNMVPLKELNLTNRFLFDEVMEDSQTQQEVLSIIFGKEIPLLQNETEKEFRISPAIRSIRMDVFSMDEKENAYSTEMQNCYKPDLQKRSRYYQALMDTSLLEPGIPNYNQLNNTFLIIITTFDLFGKKKYQYTFRARCEEAPDCVLNDGATRIFLNTRGENDGEVSEELVEFLHYLEETTDELAQKAGSQRIRNIHRRVCKVKTSEAIGVKYMQAWEERYYEKEEAREEGRAEGERDGLEKGRYEKLKELVAKKMAKGQSEKQIAEALEESVNTIRILCEELAQPKKT
ncbi:MAG: Rpn family recombination-promoting nuclease/putative transposase [Lachnospiraceae bacterium]|nr:Rpn family recombination-promoting nuclease/putative transposase [Lachnospiraceae bacterium]